MSRFTLASLRNTTLKLVSKYDPAIDWQQMEEQGVSFAAYNAKQHSAQICCLPGAEPLAFYCHSPTVRERITAFEMAGIEVDTESGVKYIGSAGSGAKYAPGNGELVGLTSAGKFLALFCIDGIGSLQIEPFKEKNQFGLMQVTTQALEAIAPVENGNIVLEALEPILIEIGSVFLNEDPESGKY